jgi:penicillin-binding protein 2
LIGFQNKENKNFSRRAFFVAACQGLLLGVLGGRLAWLQIVEGSKYKTLSEKNRINTKFTIPSRGGIIDRYGVPLAINKENYYLLAIPEKIKDLEESLKKLKNIIDISDEEILNILEKAKNEVSFVPIEVKNTLQWDDVTKLEVNIPFLPGMSVERGEVRNYPYHSATAHLIGYVGVVTKEDLEKRDPILKLPGFRIGKTGIEKSYDHILRGEAGALQYEVNVQGRQVRELSRLKNIAGKQITLTIDAEYQRFCQEKLSQHKSASCVVMNAHTGEIYSMASHPTFDPNLFSSGISNAEWQEILNNPAFPMNNKALSGQYPPGSTFKMITALAALENGIATPTTSIKCTGRYELGKNKYHCWKLSGHGSVNAVTALMESCDSYYYELSTEIGIEKIADMARRFGLGQTYDFDISQESSGLIPTKKWKQRTHKQVWRPGDTVISSIGQGYILTTPLQLAVMTARLVNGGYAIKPYLVSHLEDRKIYQEKWPKIDIKKSNLDIVKKGMDYSVNHRDGTAYGSISEDRQYAYGGKTGTAQVKKINRAQRALGITNDDLEWKYRHHALFVGYAPLQNPKYICSVVVEHGGGGSAVAAPLAKDLLLEIQKRKLD